MNLSLSSRTSPPSAVAENFWPRPSSPASEPARVPAVRRAAANYLDELHLHERRFRAQAYAAGLNTRPCWQTA